MKNQIRDNVNKERHRIQSNGKKEENEREKKVKKKGKKKKDKRDDKMQ